MIEAEPGTILDDATPKGKNVYATLVVDPTYHNEDGQQGRNGWGERCPICGKLVRRSFKAYCTYHDSECFCCYCPDCWLLFERVWIGWLDDDGGFHAETYFPK